MGLGHAGAFPRLRGAGLPPPRGAARLMSRRARRWQGISDTAPRPRATSSCSSAASGRTRRGDRRGQPGQVRPLHARHRDPDRLRGGGRGDASGLFPRVPLAFQARHPAARAGIPGAGRQDDLPVPGDRDRLMRAGIHRDPAILTNLGPRQPEPINTSVPLCGCDELPLTFSRASRRPRSSQFSNSRRRLKIEPGFGWCNPLFRLEIKRCSLRWGLGNKRLRPFDHAADRASPRWPIAAE